MGCICERLLGRDSLAHRRKRQSRGFRNSVRYSVSMQWIRNLFQWLLSGARPLDLVMLVIELAILVLIGVEFSWTYRQKKHERDRRERMEQDLERKLATLSNEEAAGLRRLALAGVPPEEVLSGYLKAKLFPIFVRDSVVGWKIEDAYVEFIREWALTNQGR